MVGVDDNIAMFGDWITSNPSSRTFFASFNGNRLLSENGSEVPLMVEPEKPKGSVDSMVKDEDFEFEIVRDQFTDPRNVLNAPKQRSGGGLAERVAAKAGFNALKINISRGETVNLSSPSTDTVCSPFVTIPPGLSPTTLLDSPVFLFNNLAQPSPTTGKFPLLQCTNPCSITSEVAREDKVSTFVDTNSDSFAFKPRVETTISHKMVSTVNQSCLIAGEVSAHPYYLHHSGSLRAREEDPQKQQAIELQPVITELSERKGPPTDYQFNKMASDSAMRNEDHHPNEPDAKEPKGESAAVAPDQQSEDGYNWRKYGQKQVKGSEHPRSYYKCTYPNCEVKKKVERSPEGRVIEIIYKGKHIHPKPPPNRRTTHSSLNLFSEIQVNGSETFDTQPSTESKSMWTNPQNEAMGHDWRNDGLDASSSVSLAVEFCNPSTTMNTHDDPHFDPTDAIDVSSTMSNEEDEQATHQSACLAADGDEVESESKRRKLDNSLMDVSVASRAVNREPRVVVQTTSEVDILDDGYRWRKYGQKVVKGNPNPRSYYKCTSAGCPVRKHVERASHDLKSVITTYEGKHNHEVPAARNGGHSNSNSSSMGASSISQSHNINKRTELAQAPDGYSQFNMPLTVGSFEMHRSEQPGASTGFSFGLGQPGIANLALTRYGPALQAKTMLPMHPYFGQRMGSDAGMIVPKGEPREAQMLGSAIPMSNNASVYQQLMGGLTLGPQM